MQALAAVAIFESVIAALSVRRVLDLKLAFKTLFLENTQAVGDSSEAN